MGDDDDRVVKFDQELLEPCDRVEIEVVRGLVEQQDIRVAEEGLCKQHLDLQGAVEVAHLRIVKLGRDTESVEEHRRVGFCLPAVHLGKFGLELARLDAVLVGEILLGIDGILLLHDLIEPCVAHDDGIHDGVAVVFEVILLEDGETLPRCDGDIALGGIEISGEDLEKSGLAGTVGTDEAIAVAFGELDVDIFEQGLFAHTVGYIVCTDHEKNLYFLENKPKNALKYFT